VPAVKYNRAASQRIQAQEVTAQQRTYPGQKGDEVKTNRNTASRTCLVFSILLGLAAPTGLPAEAETAANVVSITIDGAAQNVLFATPPSPPVAAVVMFPGGDGWIGVSANGSIARPANFLIRTQAKWLARGFLFVAVDAAQSLAGTKGDRVGAANQRAIAEIVRAVRQRTTAPIWLVGTSAGAPAAVAGAASLPPNAIRGVVISSPVSVSGPRDSVFDVPLRLVTVPVLIQIHRYDGCQFTPPANAARIKATLTSARAVEVQEFSGGDAPRSAPCEAFAQHGFIGLEDRVVNAAADWIVSH
jgi:alpha-beta hydrolase superfamily lysophospholipase